MFKKKVFRFFILTFLFIVAVTLVSTLISPSVAEAVVMPKRSMEPGPMHIPAPVPDPTPAPESTKAVDIVIITFNESQLEVNFYYFCSILVILMVVQIVLLIVIVLIVLLRKNHNTL